MSMKHTPGEWIVMPGTKAPRICVDGDPDWPIVVKVSGHSPEGIEANQNLIAAAPELLEIAKACEPMLEALIPVVQLAHPDLTVKFADAVKTLGLVIAKAEGRK